MENIVDLETKTIELLNSIQAIKYSKKIIHHDLKFSDIENLNHVLIALVKTTLNQTEDEKKIGLLLMMLLNHYGKFVNIYFLKMMLIRVFND